MADFNLDKLVPGSPFTGQNVRLSSPPCQKTVLKTAEHSWTKTICSKQAKQE